MLCIFALPRSRTAWLADWLTQQGHECLHEPLADCQTVADLPTVLGGRSFADTGASLHHEAIRKMFPDATFIVITRPLTEVKRSLRKLGLTRDMAFAASALMAVPGRRFRFSDLSDYNVLRQIWALASDAPFDEERAFEMVQRNIQNPIRPPRNPDLYRESTVDHIAHISPKGKMIVAGSQKAIYQPQFKELFDGALQQAKGDMAQVCAQIVYQLVMKGVENVGQLSPEELWGDRMVDDAVMDALFEWLQKNGYEVNQQIYAQALDMLETAAATHDAQAQAGEQPQQAPDQAQNPAAPGAPPADFANAGLAGG